MADDAATIRLSRTPKPVWVGWLLLFILPMAALAVRNLMPAWAFMWTLAFSIYAGFKWLSWWKARRCTHPPAWRSLSYLLAWPGMDAASFLDAERAVPAPALRAWAWAILKTAFGTALLCLGTRTLPPSLPLLRGWTGMLGAVLVLHFGTFEISALFWQSRGIDARAIMKSPLRATTLTEFWGGRWNLGFRQLAHDLVFQPLHKKLGAGNAAFLVFVLSGLVHDLVISVPAGCGFGLPTLYFALQGAGAALEHSPLGRQLGLRKGFGGWLFMAVFAAAPLFLLFHPPFVRRVILPFLVAIRAI